MLMVSAVASAAVLRGRVVDGATEDARTAEALIQASVRVLAAADSSLVKGAVTDASGRFQIANLNPGRYVVEVSYVGYKPQYRNLTVADSDIRLRPFRLDPQSVALAEAVVKGVRTPVKVMEDTVEYSAESYRTPPNAVVEDLLKRLPGVEVGSDGKITANGKEVTRILVDGKDFFSDDPTVASRNLPVDMVEKLQVVDRKSDLARMTGVDDGEDETVINLTVKKDRNNGWFGNAEAGYGTDGRYRGTFNINRFSGGNQFTLLGSANNVNEPGFTSGASGRFRHFGGMNGINATQSIGMNFNVGCEETFRVGGDVFYSHSEQNTHTTTDRTYLFTDSTSRSMSWKTALDRTHNISANFRLQWKPDSFNTIEFRPTFRLIYSRGNSADSTRTFAGDRNGTEVSRSVNRESSRGHSVEFSGRFIFNHNFRSRRGRSLSLFANYRLSDTREYSDAYSLNTFYLLDSLDLYDQYLDNRTWSNTVSARASWTEPLGDVANGNYLTVAYRFSYRWNNADRLTYDHEVLWPDGFGGMPVIGDELRLSPELSNRFRNDFMDQDIRLGFRHVTKKANFNIGISLVPSMSKSLNLIDSEKSIPLRRVLNVAPFLRYRYRMSKTRNLAADYNGRSSQPSMTQLQPVADRTDPMKVVVGNPELKPAFTHNARLRFQDFNTAAQRSVMLMLDAQLTQNSIVSRTDFDANTGAQTTTYQNVDGVWSVRLMNMFSLPLRNKAFTVNNHLFVNYASTVGFNNSQRNRSGSFSVSESFGMAWRPENVELELRPRYTFQNVSNSMQKNAAGNVHTYGGTFYATYNAPFGLVLSSDIDFQATSGYSDGFDTRTWMWNASVGYQFLKGKAATVSLKAYDILGQRSNVRRSVTANYIDDQRYKSLQRYIMVTVAYRFNTFGRGQQPEVGGFDGPGGPGGPPRGRMHRGGPPM